MLRTEQVFEDWITGSLERGASASNRRKPLSTDGKTLYVYEAPIAKLDRVGKRMCYITNDKKSMFAVKIAYRAKQEAKANGFIPVVVPDVTNHDKELNESYLFKHDRYGYLQFRLKEKVK